MNGFKIFSPPSQSGKALVSLSLSSGASCSFRTRFAELIILFPLRCWSGDLFWMTEPKTRVPVVISTAVPAKSLKDSLIKFRQKHERYADAISWIRTKVSFALLRSCLLCLRGCKANKKSSYFTTDISFAASVEGERLRAS